MSKSIQKKDSLTRPVVLIGMMGAGKTSVGRALAALFSIPFFDADSEIEAAAGRSVAQIFTEHGEGEFRRLEAQVIARLLQNGVCVLSVGGGAFMNFEIRNRIKKEALSIWLKVDRDILLSRVLRHGDRPLLKSSGGASGGEEVRVKMARLLSEREPIYAQADLTVLCDDRPLAQTARRVGDACQKFCEIIKDGSA